MLKETLNYSYTSTYNFYIRLTELANEKNNKNYDKIITTKKIIMILIIAIILLQFSSC